MAIDPYGTNSTKKAPPKPIKRGGAKPQAGKKKMPKKGGRKRGC